MQQYYVSLFKSSAKTPMCKKILNQLILLFLIFGRIRCTDSDFIWGVATAAYQIEGATSEEGRGPSIWDTFSKLPNKINNGDNGDVADGSYYLYGDDIQLIKNMKGVGAYRFSISWSRILPNGNGVVNEQAVKHYSTLIDALLAAGIEPLVTIYHWDLPQNLEDKYAGWLSSEIERDFANYARICFERFGDRVKKWITINEPWTSCFMGYVLGKFAPGRCSDRSRCLKGNSSVEGYIAAHNMLNAHASVVEMYRQEFQLQQGGVIGITLNHDWAEPLTQSDEDREAADIRNEFAMGWFADPLVFGSYPPWMVRLVGPRLPSFTSSEKKRLIGSYDFIGLNHYSSKFYSKKLVQPGVKQNASLGGWADDQLNEESKYDPSGNIIGVQADSKWLNVVPWGFYNVIMWTTKRYNKPLIYITENGVDAPDESTMDMEVALKDDFRVAFYNSYISEMRRAMADHANIAGYFAWSLLDNFEWADGYSCRFGLHYVDYSRPDRPRYPKKSAKWFSEFASQHPTVSSLLAKVDSSKPGSATEDVLESSSPRTARSSWMQLWTDAITAAVNNVRFGAFLLNI